MTLFRRALHLCLTTVVVLLVFVSASFAQSGNLTFIVNPAQQSGTAGSQVIFTGTITNNTGDEVSLDFLSTNFTSGGIVQDSDVFFNSVPFSLADGESTSGALFGLTLSPTLSGGNYTGTATLGAGDGRFQLTQNIQVNVRPNGVVAAPEPGSAGLIAAVLSLLLLTAASRRRTSIQQ